MSKSFEFHVPLCGYKVFVVKSDSLDNAVKLLSVGEEKEYLVECCEEWNIGKFSEFDNLGDCFVGVCEADEDE